MTTAARSPILQSFSNAPSQRQTSASEIQGGLGITLTINAAIWRSFVAPEHDLRIRGREIRLPTWLSFGLFDPLIPANKDCRAASRTLPGAEYHVFRTGHIPFAEAPEEFMDKLQPFLDRVTVDNRGS
jgi:pimeloyl-ACP methyl ester carboxylesterase